jgi:hypothetical protein
MAYTTVYNDVVFIEGNDPDARVIGNVSSDLSFKIGAQLKNLNDIKKELSEKVKYAGGNCVVDFKYGQKHRIIAIDDIAFWGSGKASLLPDETYNKIVRDKS